jgi:hypothetical protein
MHTGTDIRTFFACGVMVATALMPDVAAADRVDTCIRAAEEAQPLMAASELRAARQRLLTCAQNACPRAVRADCEEWLRDVERDVASVDLSVVDAHGVAISFASSNSKLRVFVDDRVIAEKLVSSEVVLDPGKHRFRFEVIGEKPIERLIALQRGERHRNISVSFSPNAIGDEGEEESAEVRATADGEARIDARVIVTSALAGAALVSAGMAAYFSLASNAAERSVEAYRATNARNACAVGTGDVCRTWSDAVDDQDRNAAFGRGFYVGAGVLALGALSAWLLIPAPRTRAGGILVVPNISSRAAGLSVGGSF